MKENTMNDCREFKDVLEALTANCEAIKHLQGAILAMVEEFENTTKTFIEEYEKESYTDMALKTLNKDVFEQRDLLLNASLGLSGEVGEVNDIIKKYMYHGHKLDNNTKEKVILELGDVCWYVALMAWAIDKTKFEDVLNRNLEKLDKRYQGEFSTEKSVNRKEDSEEKKNDSDNSFETFVKRYDEELDKMRINCMGDYDGDYEFETTLAEEAWHKLVRYFENEADTQEEYYARQSKEEEEEKDIKKTSDDDTKTNNDLSVEDLLDEYYNARRFGDFINLLFGKKDSKKQCEEETRTIKDLWL